MCNWLGREQVSSWPLASCLWPEWRAPLPGVCGGRPGGSSGETTSGCGAGARSCPCGSALCTLLEKPDGPRDSGCTSFQLNLSISGTWEGLRDSDPRIGLLLPPWHFLSFLVGVRAAASVRALRGPWLGSWAVFLTLGHFDPQL